MSFKEGDQVRVLTVEPNYQLQASNFKMRDATVVTPQIPAVNLRQQVLDGLLGKRVGVRFPNECVVTRVRSRCIRGLVPTKNAF